MAWRADGYSTLGAPHDVPGYSTAAGKDTSGNVIATNIKNYYQTVNSANSTVADNGNHTTQITNAGCPSTATDWTRYLSWKTTGDYTINSHSNVFSPDSYGFKALVAGTYKITVNMAFLKDKIKHRYQIS